MFGDCKVFLPDLVQFLFIHFLEIKHHITRSAGRTNDLIQFYLQGFRVSILRVLNKKDHQKGDDRCSCVNDELPRIAKAEQWAGNAPYDYYCDSKYESDRSARDRGRVSRKPREQRNVICIAIGLMIHTNYSRRAIAIAASM